MENRKLYVRVLFISLLAISCSEKKESDGSIAAIAVDAGVSADTQKSPKRSNVYLDSASIPNRLIAETLGDLDHDGVDEKVAIYNTDTETELGLARKILICKFKNDTWEVWHESTGGILSSEHGGMMGDPFQSLEIENGCIVIDHSGGSRTKWGYTHRYRFQKNDWYLIGATIDFGEAPCNWNTFDYNVSTGRLDVTKNTYECGDGEEEEETGKDSTVSYSTIIKLDKLPLMDKFSPGDNEVEVPDHKEDIFYY